MKTLPPHARNITPSEPSLRDRIIERARGGVLPILASLGIVMTGCAPGPKPDMGGKYTFATPEIMRSGEFPVTPLVSKGTFCSGALVSFQGQDYISTIAHCIPGIVYQWEEVGGKKKNIFGGDDTTSDRAVLIPANSPLGKKVRSTMTTSPKPLVAAHAIDELDRYDRSTLMIAGCRPENDASPQTQCFTYTATAHYDPSSKELYMDIPKTIFEQIAVQRDSKEYGSYFSVGGASGGVMLDSYGHMVGNISWSSIHPIGNVSYRIAVKTLTKALIVKAL